MLKKGQQCSEMRFLFNEAGGVISAVKVAFDETGKVKDATDAFNNPLEPNEHEGKVCYRLASGQIY